MRGIAPAEFCTISERYSPVELPLKGLIASLLIEYKEPGDVLEQKNSNLNKQKLLKFKKKLICDIMQNRTGT